MMEVGVRWEYPPSKYTTSPCSGSSGSARITHPFHPLNGESFTVLKRRRYGGIETVILRGPSDGSFAVPLEWTDWQPPSPEALRTDLLACDRLLEALKIVRTLERKSEKHIDE